MTVTLNRPQTRKAVAERADCADLVPGLRRADADLTDHQEAVNAFVEKRRPSFTGR